MNSVRAGAAGFIFAGTMLLQAACSSIQITHEASALAKPSWANALPQKTGMLYFVGIASNAETLEQGREAAMKDALAKVSSLMAIKVQSHSDDLLTDTEQHIRRQIISRSSATVRGAYETDAYHEKTVRVEKNIRMEKFDVYVLVGIPAIKVEAEIEQQRRDNMRKVADANDLYRQGQRQMERRYYAEAKQLFARALKTLDGIEDIVALPDGVKDNRQLVMLLKAEMQKATARLKSVSLAVHASGAFYPDLAAKLNAEGYTITSVSPAFEVSGEVSLKEGGSVWGGWVCYAEGHLTAIRSSDGHVIATISVSGKGLHQNHAQAIADALADASEKAGNELVSNLSNTDYEKPGRQFK